MDFSSSTEDLGGKPECSVSLDQPVSCLLSKQRRYGVVRFIGRTQFGPGVWCGIELNEPHGKNDGAVGGVRYFKCEAYYGIFVKAKNAQPIRADSEIGSHSNNKQGRRRVLPSLGQESPAVLFDELQDRKKKATPPDDDKDVNEDPEERPRSKSEIVLTNDRTDMLHIFSSSPFKCDIRGGKSSSLSKLNNATYICNSPASPSLFENEVFRDPKHSSPLSSLQDPSAKPSSIHSYHEHDGSSSTHVAKSSAMTHCTQLSPQFEVKQSIKLGSIKNTRLLGLSASVEGREATMNKTFLIRKENPEFESKAEDLNSKELLTDTASNVNVSNGKSSSTGESVMEASSETQRSCKKENLNSTFVSIDGSNCDFTEARSRSVSKSSWSSIESLSSVGSAKTDKERRKVKTTEAYNGLSSKIPRTQDSSKSKLVKISAGCRGDSKRCKEEESSTAGCRGDSKRCKEEQSSTISGMDVSITSGNKSVESRKTLSNKSRTKSTSAVSSGRASSALHTTAPKSTVKHKSKSVSSDGKEKSATIKNRSGASKLVTPQVPKVSGALSSRHVTSTPVRATPMREKKSIVSCVATTTGSKPSTSSSSTSRGKQLRSMSQSESSKTESRISSRQFKTKVVDCDKRQTRPEHSRPATEKTRSVSTSAAENRDTSGSVLKSSSVKPAVLRVSETFSSAKKSSRLPRKLLETSSDRAVVKKKPHSEDSIKKQDGKANTVIQNSVMVNRLSSAHTPDILQQTPEIKGQSVGIQVASLKAERYEQLRTIDEQQGQRFISELSIRNRQFEATLIALQVYAQKVDDDYENIERLKMCLKSAKERCLNAERKIAKETKERSRLEDEILVVKSESVVELALLKAEYERKQDLIRSKLVEDHKQDLEKARKRNVKMMEELKRGRDLKMKRVEETYVQDITQMKENHRNAMAELELQHSKAVEELVEERHAEIETIKADYEEQMEQLQDRLSESDGKCNKLTERLKAAEEESKRDIDLRIQDAIAKYKTLPDELESMKFVLEMKNNEVKKLRQSNGDLQNQIDELQRVRDRAALLEREKESLNFVVENKVQFERQLSLERDKLRLSLDREVAASKRLSLENEELAWRLNAYQNSPTSPTFDRTSWRMSGLNSPDSAMFSQRIEESDLESQIDDTKERSS